MTAPFPRFDGTQACAQPGVDPEMFFPGEKAGQPTWQRALDLCNGDGTTPPCPFRDPCLAYAITHDVRGVWGGSTPAERRDVQNREHIKPVPLEFSQVKTGAGKRAPCATDPGYYGHLKRAEEPCTACRQAHNVAALDRAIRRKRAAS